MKRIIVNSDGERVGAVRTDPFKLTDADGLTNDEIAAFEGVADVTDVDTDTPPVNPDQLAAEQFNEASADGKRQTLRNVARANGYALVSPGEVSTANATRYEEGDEVSTPQGVGVVADVLTETVETDEDTIEASDSSPTYVVVVEDGRVGYETYTASDIHSTTIETDVDATGAMSEEEETANAFGRLLNALSPTSNSDFSPPPSWRQSSTPNRIIALKAFASMGASFDGCTREMRGEVTNPDRYCGSFLDYVIGNPYWRGDSILPGD